MVNGRDFRIITLDGRSAVLSHENIRSPYRVGRYGVDLAVLEDIGVSAVRDALARHQVVVIDEIGKMELFSARFCEAVLESLVSGKKVLATVMLAQLPFADQVKRRSGVSVVMLDRSNWQKMLDGVVMWLGRASSGKAV